jgi:hypothetical protein
MSKRDRTRDDSLRCSFCHKAQAAVGKLISSPSDYPRAYICDECIAVCQSILDDDKAEPANMDESSPTRWSHPLLNHPLAPSLMRTIENWVREESIGQDWVPAFAEVRRLAIQMFGASAKQDQT